MPTSSAGHPVFQFVTLAHMGAIKDLWQSERGLVAIALILATTVLSALGLITPDQWLDQTRWLFLTYAAAKTVTGVVAAAKAPADPSGVQVTSVEYRSTVPTPTPPTAVVQPTPPTPLTPPTT